MILFDTFIEKDQSKQVVILLGAGLVGGALVDTLISKGMVPRIKNSLNWYDQGQFRRQLNQILTNLAMPKIIRIDWIWAAGKVGFGADQARIDQEINNFNIFLNIVEKSRTIARDINTVFFHLISSAGGLFEGQQCIDLFSEPSPRRPYGDLKLQQEKLATDNFGNCGLNIYRLSSVYGFIRSGRRTGLISVLVRNSLRQQTTLFNGRFDTLRDYVWANDIAEFITDRILSDPCAKSSTSILASGKPTSIFEICKIVQHATKKQAYIYCMADTSNAENITFMPSVLPFGWKASSLSINIHNIVGDAICKGGVMPQAPLN
jgi:nucleoside-diphosphate-sugar epimerase